VNCIRSLCKLIYDVPFFHPPLPPFLLSVSYKYSVSGVGGGSNSTARECLLIYWTTIVLQLRRLPPQLFKSRGIGGGVHDVVLSVPVAELVLNEPRVRTLVGQRKAARMTQHVAIPQPSAVSFNSSYFGQVFFSDNSHPQGVSLCGLAPS